MVRETEKNTDCLNLIDLKRELWRVRRVWFGFFMVGAVSNPVVAWLMMKLPNDSFYSFFITLFCVSAAMSILAMMAVLRKLLTYSYEDFSRDRKDGVSIVKITYTF